MAVVSITIPDPLVPRVRAAARATYPQFDALTDVEAFKAITAHQWKMVVVGYESRSTGDQTGIDMAGIG